MAHGPHCPSLTTSKYLGNTLNVNPAQAATLTLGVSFVKGLLGTLMTGKADFSELGREAMDVAAQAIEHPNTYHPTPHRRFP